MLRPAQLRLVAVAQEAGKQAPLEIATQRAPGEDRAAAGRQHLLAHRAGRDVHRAPPVERGRLRLAPPGARHPPDQHRDGAQRIHRIRLQRRRHRLALRVVGRHQAAHQRPPGGVVDQGLPRPAAPHALAREAPGRRAVALPQSLDAGLLVPAIEPPDQPGGAEGEVDAVVARAEREAGVQHRHRHADRVDVIARVLLRGRLRVRGREGQQAEQERQAGSHHPSFPPRRDRRNHLLPVPAGCRPATRDLHGRGPTPRKRRDGGPGA